MRVKRRFSLLDLDWEEIPKSAVSSGCPFVVLRVERAVLLGFGVCAHWHLRLRPWKQKTQALDSKWSLGPRSWGRLPLTTLRVVLRFV